MRFHFYLSNIFLPHFEFHFKEATPIFLGLLIHNTIPLSIFSVIWFPLAAHMYLEGNYRKPTTTYMVIFLFGYDRLRNA